MLFLAAVAVWLLILESGNLLQAADSPGQREALSKATREILEKSEKFVLVSIDPTPPGIKERDKREAFHNHSILGQTVVSDPNRKSELLTALYGGASESRGRLPGCFNPRHGIIATAGTNKVELVICFECGLVDEYSNSNLSRCLISDSPHGAFNRTLTEAGVPLAKH
jgi:hypothetical protein